MFRSKYCWLVFSISLVVAYFLVKKFLTSFTDLFVIINTVLFLILFSLSLTCNIRIIRKRVEEVKRIEIYRNGIISVILYLIGFTALQTCFVSGFCGINLTISLLSTILPAAFLNFFVEYGKWVLFATNILLLISLFSMKCFLRKKLTLKLKTIY